MTGRACGSRGVRGANVVMGAVEVSAVGSTPLVREGERSGESEDDRVQGKVYSTEQLSGRREVCTHMRVTGCMCPAVTGT